MFKTGHAPEVGKPPGYADAEQVSLLDLTSGQGIAMYPEKWIAATRALAMVVDAETAQWAAMCIPVADIETVAADARAWLTGEPRLVIFCAPVGTDGKTADPDLTVRPAGSGTALRRGPRAVADGLHWLRFTDEGLCVENHPAVTAATLRDEAFLAALSGRADLCVLAALAAAGLPEAPVHLTRLLHEADGGFSRTLRGVRGLTAGRRRIG